MLNRVRRKRRVLPFVGPCHSRRRQCLPDCDPPSPRSGDNCSAGRPTPRAWFAGFAVTGGQRHAGGHSLACAHRHRSPPLQPRRRKQPSSRPSGSSSRYPSGTHGEQRSEIAIPRARSSGRLIAARRGEVFKSGISPVVRLGMDGAGNVFTVGGNGQDCSTQYTAYSADGTVVGQTPDPLDVWYLGPKNRDRVSGPGKTKATPCRKPTSSA